MKVFGRDLTNTVGVKICGIRSGEQAADIIDCGADFLGINLWPESKRYIPLSECAPWLRELGPAVPRIAVTVNATDAELSAIVDSEVFDAVQLHGDETLARYQELLKKGWPVFRALRVRSEEDLKPISSFPHGPVLLDAYAPNDYGGSGESFDWQLASRAREYFPQHPVFLAGGLVPENVANAIEEAQPLAVDVASGVESSPGIKDIGMVADFIAAAKSRS